MTMKHNWNTGRLYTKDGQPMRAIFRPESAPNECWFQDEGRMITARIAVGDSMPEPSSHYGLREFVMHNYDHCNYMGKYLGDTEFNEEWNK